MGGFSFSEQLWFGDATDDAAETAAVRAMGQMSASVLGLRSLPSVVHEIIRESRSNDGSVRRLASLVERDSGFAARTLRLVNSAAISSRVRCKSIVQAVSLLGLRTMAELATAMATMDLFDDQTACGIALRRHATAVAAIGRQLATRLGLPLEDVYICGLMHDLGKLFMLQEGPEDYEEILTVRTGFDAVHLVEREAWGYDHAVLAGHVLRSWEIPEPVPTVVAWHHQVSRALSDGGHVAQVVSLVRVADRLAHLSRSALTDGTLAAIASDTAAQYLDLGEKQIEDWWVEFQAVGEEENDDAEVPAAEPGKQRAAVAVASPVDPCSPVAPGAPVSRSGGVSLIYWALGISAALALAFLVLIVRL